MKDIFHAYDVRGLSHSQITDKTMYLLGAGFAKVIEKRQDLSSPIIVGRDGRTTSESFTKSFIQGLVDQGIKVIDIGLCTTPMNAFAVRHLKAGGGAMITASHNPKEYNGVKIQNKDGLNLSPKNEIAGMETFHNEYKDKAIPSSSNKGTIQKLDISKDYIDFLAKHLNTPSNLKISADMSNGVASIPFNLLASHTKLNVSVINNEIDGNFPNHAPDPTEEGALDQLKDKVMTDKSNFGVIFDGDADRAGFVDEKGAIIPADIIGCLIADYILEKNKGGKVIHDLFCTKAISDVAKERNAEAIMIRVGRYFIISQTLSDPEILFGFEKSGHFYHREFYGLDSAMLTFIKVANIIAEKQKPLSEIVKKYQKYETTPIISLHVNNPDSILQKIKDNFSQYNLKEIDGVTIEANDFRFTIRKSNTEPLIRIAGEASTKYKLDEIKKKIFEIVQEYN